MKKKFFKFGLLLVTIILSHNIYAESFKNDINSVPFSEEYKEWLNLSDEQKQNTIEPNKYQYLENGTSNSSSIDQSEIQIPEKYSTLDLMKIKVKNQRSRNICWAFSLSSAIEIASYMLNGETYNISPMHMDYSTAFSLNDVRNPFGSNRNYNSGASINNELAYLTNGQGPILEKYMPFNEKLGDISLENMPNQLPQAKVELVKLKGISSTTKLQILDGNINYTAEMNDIRKNIKKCIMTAGAVKAGIQMDTSEYYNNETNALFYDENVLGGNHEVTLIGFDDSYSAENFNSKHKPKNDGAYIALNSYGEKFGENGIFYISYDDIIVEGNLSYIKSISEVDYDNIYQIDPEGTNGVWSFSTYDYANRKGNPIYAANIFDRNVNLDEKLTEIYMPIDFYNKRNVFFDVYVNPNGSSINQEDLIKVECDTDNLIEQKQFVKLKENIKLNSDKFAIVIKYVNNERTDSIGLAIGGNILEYGDKYSEYFASSPNQSFYSKDGINWNDMYDLGDDYESSDKSHLRHYKFGIKAHTVLENKSINIEQITGEENEILEGYKNKIDVYTTSTSNLNGSKLNVKILKDGHDITNKVNVLSLSNIKSKASNIEIELPKELKRGEYTVKVSTENGIYSTKEFKIKGPDECDELIQIEFKDENLFEYLCNNENVKDIIIKKEDKKIIVRKTDIDKITYINMYNLNDAKQIKNLDGIEKFTNLEYVYLKNLKVDNLNSLRNVKNIIISDSYITKIEDMHEFSNLNQLNFINCSFSGNVIISNLKNLNSLIFNNCNFNLDKFKIRDLKLQDLDLVNCNISDVSKVIENTQVLISLNLSENNLFSISKELLNAEIINALYQKIENNFVFENNDGYSLIDLPDIFKMQNIENIKFENCEYDESTQKIKVNTSEIGNFECKISDFSKNSNIYGSEYSISYSVVEKNQKVFISPKTGDLGAIYVLIILMQTVIILLINKLKIKKSK